MSRAFTYPEVGATLDGADALPAGYSHLRHRVVIGHGEPAFRAAADALGSFRMHRRLPVGITASAPRAEPGADVTVTLAGVVEAPCRIVRVVDEAGRYGWAYGTLTGHPECGEEAFLLDLDADGTVRFDVIAFSRPGGRAARVLGGLVPVLQRLYARRCAQVLRGVARGAVAG
ncbi:DUF1990 family protein [Streptacidiphilus jiangxiensis]|uniref:Uncharacterized protein, UPF0548 family n=1 Tax=Streptacidiphilus jiangxiensis TaxID=235985 RepID=A0A1H7VZS2_STRJI|nr:DUF1990 domain-containing protein [Streptacidiphilus jiangxiensis]SEM14369.1 Uncharacterized protein, UPF0548 family [Streptacidiphilus jiangxiensis]